MAYLWNIEKPLKNGDKVTFKEADEPVRTGCVFQTGVFYDFGLWGTQYALLVITEAQSEPVLKLIASNNSTILSVVRDC